MPVSNPTDIGSAAPAGSATTIALTTTAAVPSGAKILLSIAWWDAVNITTISDGTYTYTVHKTQLGSGGSNNSAVASVDATTGLASGATITVTFSAASVSRYMGAAYSTGLTTTGSYGPVGQAQNSTTTWSSTATTVTSGDLLWGCSHWEDGVVVTNTATGGNTELHDLSNSGSGHTNCYQIGTGASIAAQGTWTTACAAANGLTSVAVAFTASGGGPPPPGDPPNFPVAARIHYNG